MTDIMYIPPGIGTKTNIPDPSYIVQAPRDRLLEEKIAEIVEASYSVLIGDPHKSMGIKDAK